MQSTSPLNTEDHFNSLMKVVQIKEVAKKEILYHESEICKYGSYIFKGCFRYFKTNTEGEEYVTLFAFEDHWVGDLNSMTNGMPAKMSLQALEKATLMSINTKDYEYLLKKLSEICRRNSN